MLDDCCGAPADPEGCEAPWFCEGAVTAVAAWAGGCAAAVWACAGADAGALGAGGCTKARTSLQRSAGLPLRADAPAG